MLELKLVIVEDDKFLLEKLTNILTRFVKEVHSYDNAIEALEDIPNVNPDIIVSDINMPKMTGLEMYKELQEKNYKIPIILASAFSEPKYFIEAIKLKVRKFIVKPIDMDELFEELKIIENDIKEKKEFEKKEQLLIVQSKMASMGEMLTNIAHQWKQPLNTISLCTSSLELEKELETLSCKDDVFEALENIKNALNYMDDTIEDFQNYLKPNKLESCFYLKDTIDKVQNLIGVQSNLYSIKFVLNIDNIHLCSYQNELLQVLLNIVKNSLDELSKIDEKKYIFIDIYEEENNEIVIKIKDNAKGINEKIINYIFEPYFTTKESFGGTGVGLYMSKQIIENHLLGTINVKNVDYEHEGTLQKGALFEIRLKSLES
mgnify:CR=1 FL=1